MHRIHKVIFNNFKYFYLKEELEFNEKNVLIYGENGSGKSSIYWGIHAFLQSIFKIQPDVQKYFDVTSNERLLNIYKNDDSKVEIELRELGNNAIKKTISYDVVNTSDSQEIKEAARYSDFINYRLLFNHYNYFNSGEIDLFPIFEKDILPLVSFATGLKPISDATFNNTKDVWDDLNVDHEHEEIPLELIKDRVDKKAQEYPDLLNLVVGLNEEFSSYLDSLLESINEDFIKKGFDLNLNIKLELVPSELKRGALISENLFKYSVTPPKIKLIVKDLDTGIIIPKPQTFLNEAKFSAIALSIRFAALREKDVSGVFKVFVLDDFMISLDMSNRQYVMNILFNDFSDYQIIFMTHDRSLYHYMQTQIRRRNQLVNWKTFELYQSNFNGKNTPAIYDISDKQALEKAEYHLQKNDYPACGIYLRRECESILNRLLPSTSKYNVHTSQDSGIIETQAKSLNDKLLMLEDFCAKENLSFSPFVNLLNYKSVILNTLAHDDIISPLYRKELFDVYKSIKDLASIKRDVVVCNQGIEVNIKLLKQDGNIYKIGMRLRDSLKLLEDSSGTSKVSYYSKVLILGTVDNGNPQTLNIEKDSISSVLIDYCSQLSIPVPELFDVLYDRHDNQITII
jgi:hypothetical protein